MRARRKREPGQGRDHAIVLGGSMAGLLAARVLSDHFARVTVIERDDLSRPGQRPGVPQGHHVHALLARGRQVLEHLFPGIGRQLLADGAVPVRSMEQVRMQVYGHTVHRADAGYELLQASRPLVEWRVRSRVRELWNVDVVDGTEVLGLVARPDEGAVVAGVRVAAAGAAERVLDADLVLSCLGRHGPVAEWLALLGYAAPAEDGVEIDMVYASRRLRLTPGALADDREVIVAHRDPARGLALFAVENGEHQLTLIGYGGDHPPVDDEGFWRFAASVAPRDVWQELLAAEALSSVATYRYPANRRRRFERLSRFPRGLLVLGDAVCSFSPAFGQGMTMSALQALALDRALARGDVDLARRFFAGAAAAIDDAWTMTRLFDLAMPHVAGPRLRPLLLGTAVRTALGIAERDRSVGRAAARVTGLVDPPTTALRPLTVLGAGRGLLALVLDGVRPSAWDHGPPPGFDPLPLVRRAGIHPLVVAGVRGDGADASVIELTVPPGLADAFTYAGGQHVVIHGSVSGEPVERTFSLCGPRRDGFVAIAVRGPGAFADHARTRLAPGDVLHVSRPSGTFVPPAPTGPRTVGLVAAGSGIAPLQAIAHDILISEPDARVVLVRADRDHERVMLRDEVADLSTRYGDRLALVQHLTRSSGSGDAGARPRLVAGDLAEDLADEVDLWMLCGPRSLVVDVRAALLERGVAPDRVRVELFERPAPAPLPAAALASPAEVRLTGIADRRDLVVRVPRDAAVLDIALRSRPDLPHDCLGGTCGACVAVVEEGRVVMDPDPLLALDESDLDAGRVLLCRARPDSAAVTLRLCSAPRGRDGGADDGEGEAREAVDDGVAVEG